MHLGIFQTFVKEKFSKILNQLILAIKIDRVGNTDQISPIGERSRQLSHEMQSPLHSMHKTK